MKHIIFGSDISTVQVAILFKEGHGFNKDKIETNYVKPVKSVPADNFIAFDLKYENAKKCSAACAKQYISELLPEIENLGINTLLVCDAVYFKYLTKNTTAEAYYGYICPCVIPGYEHMNTILAPNYSVVLYNPDIQKKIDYSIETLDRYLSGTYRTPGLDIFKFELYPETPKEIESALKVLHKQKTLTIDIEGLSLNFWESGISTVSFAWNKHEGIAFAVDRAGHIEAGVPKDTIRDLSIGDKLVIRQLLKEFLLTYKGTLIYHNAGYDMKVQTYELWMNNLADYKGMLDGIFTLTNNFEDTKLITYVATNNAVQNVLGLKPLSAEYTGNYAQEEIKDTSKIPLPQLLRYNLEDCLATWYVYEKYKPIMMNDNQEVLYETLMKPTVKTLLQMELCGMPINPMKVQTAKTELTNLVNGYSQALENSPIIQAFNTERLIQKAAKFTEKAKKKIYTLDDSVIKEPFNPNSGPQIQALIYEYLKFPVIDLTKTKQPSTKNKNLKKLLNHTTNKDHQDIITNLMNLADANIILTTFIPAFEQAQQLPDGSYRLYGNFNLGGTQSLRLSSSNPNLQNIPSNSIFAKLIKDCFELTVPGWLFSGSDFDALEDKTGALLSRDPNKLAVYTDGFDGHCLRAFAYFKEKMIGITDAVDSINSIEKLYPELRQESKSPTFALSYKGTFITLMNNCGFSEAKAKTIEARYHELYKVADAWLNGLIENARKIGYIPLAFGGRIRTPILAKSGKGKLSYTAQKEARSAGNAATQSYCALTLRALNEYMERVWASKYKYDILPSATIHDADYFVHRDNLGCVKWHNDNLIDCMAWQELPEIQHPTIKISSSLEIYWPSWAKKIGVPNGASKKEIFEICKKAKEAV